MNRKKDLAKLRITVKKALKELDYFYVRWYARRHGRTKQGREITVVVEHRLPVAAAICLARARLMPYWGEAEVLGKSDRALLTDFVRHNDAVLVRVEPED